MPAVRRLAAILAADVAGYSRLMGADEEGTLNRLKAHRRDPDQEYFADGITDDLTTDLSRISGSFVIARNTAFTYKGTELCT